jgi:hypothetical protein
MDAVLYLLAVQAGIMDPQTIAENSRCYACIPDKQAAVLYLLDQISSGGGGGSGSVVALTGADAPTPAQGPASGGGVAYNEVPNLWVWNTTTSQWDQIV